MKTLRLCVLTAALAASPAAAQGRYAGAWTVSAWRPAPWLDSAGRAAARPNDDVLGKRVTFAARRVTGPALLACDAPKYELIAMPYEGLFEGNLPRPAADGRALGFPRAPISTLRAGCDFDFHFVNATKGAFALDNVIYTLTAARTARRASPSPAPRRSGARPPG